MERLIYPILLLVFLCTACKHDLPEPPNEHKSRTIIVYAAAENSLARFFYSDSLEMALGCNSIPKDVNFIVYKDGADYPSIYSVTAKRGFTLHKQYRQDQDSADSTVMLSTLRDIAKDFPAEHYGLILWSHGSGWISKKEYAPQKKAILIDNNVNSTSSNFGSQMDISELHWVLRNFHHLDYLFYDACFMQSVESDYELRDVVDYIIASPAEIPGNGAPYHRIMSALCQADGEKIIHEYFDEYDDNGEGVVLSLVDCKQLDALARKTAEFIPTLAENQRELETRDIQYYVPFLSSNSYRPSPFDISSAMHRHLDDTQYQEWKKYFDQAVPLRLATDSWTSIFYSPQITDREHFGGLSMFIPHSKYDYYGWNRQFQETQWYKAAGWHLTGW